VAPDRLATIRPRLAQRLTAPDQLWPVGTRCSAASSLEERGVGALFRAAHSYGAFSSPKESCDRPLTSPVVSPSLRLTRKDGETRTAFAAHASTWTTTHGPRRLPSTDAPWRALSRAPFPIGGEPATVLVALPRTSRLPTLFHLDALARCEARPNLVVHALFAHGRGWPRASCRLLLPHSIREHDHGRPNSAAPHPRSPADVASLPASRARSFRLEP
jgi:hypothetical protein